MKISTTAERLQQVMDERGLRQVDVVELCKPFCEKYDIKINKPHISQYLSGSSKPRQDKLAILSQALGVDESWLMGYGELEREATRKDLKDENPPAGNRGISEVKEELLKMVNGFTEQEAAVYLAALKSALKKE